MEYVADPPRTTWNTSPIPCFVNNAGFGQMVMFEDTTEELFDDFMLVLVEGPYFLTETLLPLIEGGGAIVNSGSNSALINGLEPGYSPYASMKGAILIQTRYMAKEFSPRGIRVDSVAPGSTRTRIANDAFSKYPGGYSTDRRQDRPGTNRRSGRHGKAIAFLLSDECARITAQTIDISGGYIPGLVQERRV